jgi:hypothetical protein
MDSTPVQHFREERMHQESAGGLDSTARIYLRFARTLSGFSGYPLCTPSRFAV